MWASIGVVLMASTAVHGEKLIYFNPFDWVEPEPPSIVPSDGNKRDFALRTRPGMCWCGGHGLDGFCDNPDPTDDTPGERGRENHGSEGALDFLTRCPNPGEDVQPGFVFWNRNGITRANWVYTDAVSCTSASHLTRMSWLQADHDSANMGSMAFLVQEDAQEVWYVSVKRFNAENFKQLDSHENCTAWQSFDETNLQALQYYVVGPNGPDTGGFGSLVLPDWPDALGPAVTGLPEKPLLAVGFSWNEPRKRQRASCFDELSLYAEDHASCRVQSGCIGAPPSPSPVTPHPTLVSHVRPQTTPRPINKPRPRPHHAKSRKSRTPNTKGSKRAKASKRAPLAKGYGRLR